MFLKPTTTTEVVDVIASIKNTNNLYDVPSKVIKIIALEISDHLTALINVFLLWLLSQITKNS